MRGSRDSDRGALHVLRPVLPVAAVTAGALIVANQLGCGSESETRISPGSTVEDIRISTAVPLIDVIGRTSVTASQETEVPGIIPFIGGNKVPLTERSTTATVSGAVELRLDDRKAMKLAAYKLPREDASKPQKWGIRATVDADRIHMRPSISTLFVDGEPQVQANQELLGFSSLKGVAKRTAKAEAGGAVHFTTACGGEALSTLSAGVKQYVRDITVAAAELQTNLPGGLKEAVLMREMVEDPQNIQVSFTQDSTNTIEVDPTSINLRVFDTFVSPPEVVTLKDKQRSMQELLHTSEEVTLNTGQPCTFTAKAAGKLHDLSGNGLPPRA